MKVYARIENGVVAELIEGDDVAGRFHPSLRFVDVSGLGVLVGWLEADGRFVAPPPPSGQLPAPDLASLQAELALLAAKIAAMTPPGAASSQVSG